MIFTIYQHINIKKLLFIIKHRIIEYMKEISEKKLKAVELNGKNYPQDEKSNVYIKDKIFVISSKKIQENSCIFRKNQSNLYYELNEEKKENIEKFFQILTGDLHNGQNSSNLADILSFYLTKENKTISNNNNYIHQFQENKHFPECKNINFSLNYYNKKENYTNYDVNLISKYKSFKPKFSYMALKNLFFPRIFFSKHNYSTPLIYHPKMLTDVRNRFMKSSNGYLNLIENFFKDKKNPFNLQYYLENKQSKSTILNKEDLCKEQKVEAQRLLLFNFDQQFSRMNQEAILIQKYIRGYLLNRRIVRNYKNIFLEELNKIATVIQTNFRRFNCGIKYKKAVIMEKCKEMIKLRQEKIFSMIRSYQLKKTLRLSMVIGKIREMQVKKVLIIQDYVRNHLLKTYMKNLLNSERNYYKITYPFKAKSVQIKIFLNQWEYKIFDFYYCRVQNIFVVYIDPIMFLKERYRFQFIVDDCVTCDGSYPHIEFNDGNYYNVIDFCVLDSKLKKTNTINDTLSTIYSDDDSFSYR